MASQIKTVKTFCCKTLDRDSKSKEEDKNVGKECNPSWSSFCSGNTHKFKCSNYHKTREYGERKGENNDYKTIYQDHNYGEDPITIRRHENSNYDRKNNQNDDSDCKYIPDVGLVTKVENTINRVAALGTRSSDRNRMNRNAGVVGSAAGIVSNIVSGTGRAFMSSLVPSGGKKHTRRKKHTRKQKKHTRRNK